MKATAHKIIDRAKARKNRAKRLRDRLRERLQAIEYDKAIEGPRFVVRVKRNSAASLLCTDTTTPVPRIFSSEPNRPAIKAMLKQGVEVPGWHLAERGYHLEVK